MESIKPEVGKNRHPEHTVSAFILNRWSPRSFTGEEIPEEDLLSIFEAAKWAPSAFNEQPWRFIYARRNTPHWEKIFNLMNESNQNWAKNTAALVVIVSSKNFTCKNKPNRTHSFDTGAAWQNLALEATAKGYYAHGMSGFDYDKAKIDLNIPDDYQVEAMCAIGIKDLPEKLPEDMQKNEKPSSRNDLNQVIMEGSFKLSS